MISDLLYPSSNRSQYPIIKPLLHFWAIVEKRLIGFRSTVSVLSCYKMFWTHSKSLQWYTSQIHESEREQLYSYNKNLCEQRMLFQHQSLSTYPIKLFEEPFLSIVINLDTWMRAIICCVFHHIEVSFGNYVRRPRWRGRAGPHNVHAHFEVAVIHFDSLQANITMTS